MKRDEYVPARLRELADGIESGAFSCVKFLDEPEGIICQVIDAPEVVDDTPRCLAGTAGCSGTKEDLAESFETINCYECGSPVSQVR